MAAEVLRQSRLGDPFRAGLDSGWKVIDASALTDDLALEADVAIVGTGAGGGTAAEILAEAGATHAVCKARVAAMLAGLTA